MTLQSVIVKRYLSSGLSTKDLPDFPSKENGHGYVRMLAIGTIMEENYSC